MGPAIKEAGFHGRGLRQNDKKDNDTTQRTNHTDRKMKKEERQRSKPKRKIAKPKAYSGNLHCRTSSEVHRQAMQYASEKGYTLQTYIETALLKQIEQDRILMSKPLYINN